MSENLSQMVKDATPPEAVFSENDLDIPTEEATEEVPENAAPETTIEIVSLADWFDGNVANFPNIKKPTVSIQGVNPAEQLIITLLTGHREDGAEERKLMVFDNADQIPVLNIPAVDMQIYNNGFRIVYDFNGMGVFIKSYGIRTGLVSVFCHDIDDMLIPYEIVRSKKRDTEIEIKTADSDIVRSHLSNPLDLEALQLLYKQSAKAEGLTTNEDAVKWLLERQADISDVNHHLQIDSVIIETLK